MRLTVAEAKALGEKGQKQLLLGLLPRLAQHEVPPPTLVPQLLQLTAESDDRSTLHLLSASKAGCYL